MVSVRYVAYSMVDVESACPVSGLTVSFVMEPTVSTSTKKSTSRKPRQSISVVSTYAVVARQPHAPW